MNRIRLLTRLRPGRAVPAALLCAVLTGCGPALSEVSGIVRYNGKPLPSGTVQFLGADGIPYAAPIRPEGTYSALVPVGEAKVIVASIDEARLKLAPARSAAASGRTAPPRRSAGGASRIPARYADWNTSGLTATVEGGGTVRDIALTTR